MATPTAEQRTAFGHRVRELRTALGMSLADLADELRAHGQGTTAQAVWGWEAARHAPTRAKVVALEDAFGAVNGLLPLLGYRRRDVAANVVHVSDSDSATFSESESVVIQMTPEALERYVDEGVNAAMARQSDRERRPESDREVTEDDFLDEPAPDE